MGYTVKKEAWKNTKSDNFFKISKKHSKLQFI